MEQLIVRLGSRSEDPVHWLVWSDREDEIIASGVLPDAGQLSTLSERAGQRPVIALAPTSDILLKWVELPPKAGRKVLSALPYMIEDELATDIESQFFAYGEKVGNQQAVAVVSRHQMDTWQHWLREAGLHCNTLLPDVLAVPHNPDGWTLLTLGEQLLLREDSWRGMQGEATWLLPTLSHYAAHQESPITLVSYADSELPELTNVTVSQPPPELPMHVLAKEALACGFNLLQGDYKIKRTRNTTWHQWRLVAALAVVAVGASLVDKSLTLYQLEQQNDEMRAEISDTVDSGFPDIGGYRNVKTAVERELARLEQTGGGASLLVMLEQLTGPFATSNVRPQSLRFDATRTEIRMQAVGDSFESLEQFRRQAEGAGFVVEQGAINNRDDEVIGTVSIRSTT